MGGISFLLAQKLKRNRILWPVFGALLPYVIIPILAAMALSRNIENTEIRDATVVGLSALFIFATFLVLAGIATIGR